MAEIIEINTVDIACVTETWLSEEIPPLVTDIDGYTCERGTELIGEGEASLLTSIIAFHSTAYLVD